MKLLDEVQKMADELKRIIEQGLSKKYIRLYHELMGLIELEKENYPGAVEYFGKAISIAPSEYSEWGSGHAEFYHSLALAYYRAGDLEKALEAYEKITSLTLGRILQGHIYAKSFYMLGKIYEKKGWKGKAIEHYERFLNLWKEADSGLPEIGGARKRLAALKE